MTTYRERRLARAEKLREWADKRETRAEAAFQRSSDIAQQIPFGQPILVGHHSERGHRADIARIDSAMRQSVESSKMAASMTSRADNIEAAAERAIYSDDPDAIERLGAKIDQLEAQRDRIKAYNAACRKIAKAHPGVSGAECVLQGISPLDMLSDRQRTGVRATARHCAYQVRPGGGMPAYEVSSLGATIRAARERIALITREREQGPADRGIIARRDGICETCGAALNRGDAIRYNRQDGARCVTCPTEATS